MYRQMVLDVVWLSYVGLVMSCFLRRLENNVHDLVLDVSIKGTESLSSFFLFDQG